MKQDPTKDRANESAQRNPFHPQTGHEGAGPARFRESMASLQGKLTRMNNFSRERRSFPRKFPRSVTKSSSRCFLEQEGVDRDVEATKAQAEYCQTGSCKGYGGTQWNASNWPNEGECDEDQHTPDQRHNFRTTDSVT